MPVHSLHRSRRELSEFLLRQRHRLSPAEVGLPAGGRRRTPGLRREEVAALAGVGLTWYTWFEQGREIQVSQHFLLAVSKALRLDDAQCAHLFLLAQQRPPPAEAHHLAAVSPLIQQLLDALSARPAYVLNLRWDVVAWNAAADALFGLAGREREECNFLRLLFTDAKLRRRLPAWQEQASGLLAQFRYDIAVAPDDPALAALVADLKRRAPGFRQGWQAANGEVPRQGIGAIEDGEGARLDFQHETLLVDPHRHLKMLVYFARPTDGAPRAQ